MRLRSLISHAPGVAFVAATLGFGGGSVLAKVILDRGVNALELLPIRFLFAVASLVAVLAVAGDLRRLDPATWRDGSTLGVVNMAAPSILMTIGLEHLSASVTALVVGLIPLTTVAFAHLLIDGSFRTIPFPWTYTKVVAVPKSMARSSENHPNTSPGNPTASLPSSWPDHSGPTRAHHMRSVWHRKLAGIQDMRPRDLITEPPPLLIADNE